MTETTNEEKLTEFIQNEKFDDAYMLYKSGEIEPEMLKKILTEVQIDTGTDLAFLSFALVLAQREKTILTNSIVVNLLVNDNVDVPGSYFLAYEYFKKILQEDPENIENLKSILFFNIVPNQVMSQRGAKFIAQKLNRKGVRNDDVDNILGL